MKKNVRNESKRKDSHQNTVPTGWHPKKVKYNTVFCKHKAYFHGPFAFRTHEKILSRPKVPRFGHNLLDKEQGPVLRVDLYLTPITQTEDHAG